MNRTQQQHTTLKSSLATQQLKWPNDPLSTALVIDLCVTLLKATMASVPVTSYAAHGTRVPLPDAELQLQVDPGLAFENPTREVIHRPPGIQTLRQWGEQVFPEGKYQGATFISVCNKDAKYTAYMKGHSHLTSPWAKSYQNFVKAMAMPVGAFPSVCLTPKASQGNLPPSPSVSEWDVLSSPSCSQRPNVPPSKGKRGPAEVEIEPENPKMDVVKDAEKQQELLTKIAILQRELDNMSQEA
eukprot:s30_g4.t1